MVWKKGRGSVPPTLPGGGGVSGAAARRWSSLLWKVLWQPSCPRKSVSLVSPFGDVRSFELDAT